MRKTAFKTEVFLTVPLTFLAFTLVCLSLVTQEWVSGKGIIESNSTTSQNGEITYNFGLFNGNKIRVRSGTIPHGLKSEISTFYSRYPGIQAIHCPALALISDLCKHVLLEREKK